LIHETQDRGRHGRGYRGLPDRQRIAIRNEYLPGPDHKALAISFLAEGFITDQADDDTAKAAALDACQKITDNINS
jgi:hypothetical protein